MSAVEVTISGVLFDKVNRTTQNVVLIGEATLTGLGVGGGPVYPPAGGGGWPSHPEHPIPPRPEHPIVLPPIVPGGPPIDIGAHPEHPIVLPPQPPDVVPSPPGIAVKPPPADGGWAYVSTWGWGYFPQGTAGPKR